MATEQKWEAKAQAAFNAFVEDVKRTLPREASFADIERALLKFSPELLRQSAEALANAEDFSPGKKRDA